LNNYQIPLVISHGKSSFTLNKKDILPLKQNAQNPEYFYKSPVYLEIKTTSCVSGVGK